MQTTVLTVPMFTDNYGYVVLCPDKKKAFAVDPADADAIRACLQSNEVELEAILATHHHMDHIAGIESLCGKKDVPVYSSAMERNQIPGVRHGLEDGERLTIGGVEIQAILVPGHTRGHMVYLCDGSLFSGDALFLGGCGRLFEGTPEEMVHSLYQKIMPLPDDVQVYPGHEYTVRNRTFCLSIDTENTELQNALDGAQSMQDAGHPTVPGTLGAEKGTNVFLRCNAPEIIASVRQKAPGTKEDPVSVFAQVRSMRDVY